VVFHCSGVISSQYWPGRVVDERRPATRGSSLHLRAACPIDENRVGQASILLLHRSDLGRLSVRIHDRLTERTIGDQPRPPGEGTRPTAKPTGTECEGQDGEERGTEPNKIFLVEHFGVAATPRVSE